MPDHAISAADAQAADFTRRRLESTSAWITPLLAFVLASFVYATGNFGFLNVYGIRREVQFIIAGVLVAFVPLLAWRSERWLRAPLFWLALLTLLAEAFLREGNSMFFLIDRIFAVIGVAILLSMSTIFRTRVLRSVVFLAAMFSLMAIAEAAYVVFHPELLSGFGVGYTSGSQAEQVLVSHPIEYLGLVTPGSNSFFGIQFSRFRSFASEPSVLICTFLVPGLLALTFKDRLRHAALPILFFAVLLSAAGTAFLSIGLGVAAWVGLRLFRRAPRFATAIPFLVGGGWLFLLTQVNVHGMMLAISTLLAPIDRYYPVLNKTTSGTVRLEPVVAQLQNLDSYIFFGSPKQGTGGLILHLLLYGGIIALTLTVVVCWRFLRSTTTLYFQRRGRLRVTAALLFGTFTQVMFFSEFGWMTMAGFMMLLLMQSRIDEVVRERESAPA